jgi:uncharacterized membrane protein YcfT
MVKSVPFQPTPLPSRVDWVDYAKGLCIIMVVMMHSTLGVEKVLATTGWMGAFVEWARPFRMPDFFLISGLFLARRIDVPWRNYADTKIVHFFYFYILWMTIQIALKSYGITREAGVGGLLGMYLTSFIEPFGTLWFIYLLPIFFALTKLLRPLPNVLVFVAAACLEVLPIHTGYILIDEFASRFVYFFAGYWLAPHIFAFADNINSKPIWQSIAALVIWMLAHSVVVMNGYADTPVVSLALGLAGSAAVVTMGVLLSRANWTAFLRYLGENSIVVYLAFFLFMAISRAILIRFMPGLGVDVISAIVTASGVIGPVILHLLVKPTPLKYLFVRPKWARVESWSKGWHTASHDAAQKLGQTETR